MRAKDKSMIFKALSLGALPKVNTDGEEKGSKDKPWGPGTAVKVMGQKQRDKKESQCEVYWNPREGQYFKEEA